MGNVVNLHAPVKTSNTVLSSLFADVVEFHHKFQLPAYKGFDFIPHDLIAFREKFLQEEAKETSEALLNRNYPEALDGFIDLAYIALGTIYLTSEQLPRFDESLAPIGVLGIIRIADGISLDSGCVQFLVNLTMECRALAVSLGWDFDSGWKRVHSANMSKVRVARPEDSKRGSGYDVIKPPNWKKPIMEDLV